MYNSVNKLQQNVQQCQKLQQNVQQCQQIAAKMYNSANKLQHFPGNLTSWVSHLETRRSVEKYSFARRIPRQALSPDQIQEIRGLRGKMSSAEAKSSLALDPIGSTKSESRPKTTPLLCPQSSRCRLSKTSLPMHLWWRKISTSAWGGWRLAWRCSERFWKKNTHILQEALFVDSPADSASVRDVDDIVDELLEVQSEPKEESQWKMFLGVGWNWRWCSLGVESALARWRLAGPDVRASGQAEKKRWPLLCHLKRHFLHGIASTDPEMF